MSSRQRREQILSELFEQRHVTARDLAGQIGVSEATVRRDLKAWRTRAGRTGLRRGDASGGRPTSRSSPRPRGTSRPSGSSAGWRPTWSGTRTSLPRLRHDVLRDGAIPEAAAGLSVIVNSARLALELDAPGLSVIMLGGQYRPDRMDTVGPLAMSTLDQLRGYICFIGADGLRHGFRAGGRRHRERHPVSPGGAAMPARRCCWSTTASSSAPSLFKIVDWERDLAGGDRPGARAGVEEFFRSRGIGVRSRLTTGDSACQGRRCDHLDWNHAVTCRRRLDQTRQRSHGTCPSAR